MYETISDRTQQSHQAHGAVTFLTRSILDSSHRHAVRPQHFPAHRRPDFGPVGAHAFVAASNFSGTKAFPGSESKLFSEQVNRLLSNFIDAKAGARGTRLSGGERSPRYPGDNRHRRNCGLVFLPPGVSDWGQCRYS